ncbi:lanthionine synthetase LanC family protein [Nocardia sp. NPDC004068]|uniref:lanthionine synthetase LanC family protein n=1 Tax=Nocardia sp. NPDC004068 TaxID=3364303 RepID=UPI00369CA9C9
MTSPQATREIAAALHAGARTARDGNLYWDRPVLLGPHLYAGTTGIALFFAAAWNVLGDKTFRDTALRAIAPLRADLHADHPRPLRQPIGGLTGIGSLVYALVRIGDLLGEDTLADDARRAAALLLPGRTDTPEEHDVMIGAAGAVLALLALDARHPDPLPGGERPLDLARHYGRRLDAADSWRIAETFAAAGFCHGRAGIDTALARLGARTGDPRPRYKDLPRSWCKGAAGIALAHLDRPELAAPLLEAAAAPVLSDTDDLCCGTCGRIDVLVHAATTLREPRHLDQAADLTDRMLARARRNARYALRITGDPRLFPGLAGIGYTLTRLHAPDRVPCVVALA